MSVLEIPYDAGVAKRVYLEEMMEDMIIKMLEKNSPFDYIMDVTGVSESEIIRIQQEYNL